MNNFNTLQKYLESQKIITNDLRRITRRMDPLDKAAGAHIPQQGEIDVFVDHINDVVYKVGPSDKLPKYIIDWRVSMLAHRKGVKVALPVKKPILFEGKSIYATQFVLNKHKLSPTPQSVAKVLLDLHQVVGSANIPIATSRLKDLALSVLQDDKAPSNLKSAIKLRVLPLIDYVEKDMQTHNTLVHGDIHLGNILATQPHSILIDFEDAGRGSPLWDIAVLVQSSTRFGLDRAWLDQMLNAWQKTSKISIDNLQHYIDWRCWYGVLSMYMRVQEGRGDHKELQRRLRWVENASDKTKWNRC